MNLIIQFIIRNYFVKGSIGIDIYSLRHAYCDNDIYMNQIPNSHKFLPNARCIRPVEPLSQTTAGIWIGFNQRPTPVPVKVFNYARLLDWTKRLRAYNL